ncbi:MAG: mitofilin family membrane protein, partial [Alphaproteobacteria bacterium]|nr:mitofilin family membrane protein [Alphaproteobacteria bacterium]
GDKIDDRPRNRGFIDPHAYLQISKADVILAFFGANEAWDHQPGEYASKLTNWIDETLAEVESLVSVRRVGEVAGDEAEAVLARAEMRLAAGKLGETAALVESLGESEASDRWLEDARVTLAARAALDAVNAAILARAGGAG